MKGDWVRTGAKQAATLGAIVVCMAVGGSVAVGQSGTTPNTAPPVFQNVDANGVDLATRRFNFDQRLLSIGPGEPHGLSYARYWNGDNWRDNLVGTLTYNQNDGLYTVSFGDHSETFREIGQTLTFSSVQANGSTLTRDPNTYNYTYVASDGTTATLTYTETYGATGAFAKVDEVRYPNGLRVSYHYKDVNACYAPSFAPTQQPARPPEDARASASAPRPGGDSAVSPVNSLYCYPKTRLQSVTNSAGYQLKLSYAAATPSGPSTSDPYFQLRSVTAINNAFEACEPSADDCALTQAWARVSFARSGEIETVTDPTNRVWTLIYETGSPHRLLAVRRPGSNVNDIAVTYDGMLVQSVSNSTGSWTYSADVGADGSPAVTVAGLLGAGRTVTYDPSKGLVTSVRDALLRTTRYRYDTAGRVDLITFPENNAVEFGYDARGNVTRQTHISKNGQTRITTNAGYAASCANAVTCNKPVWTRDAAGRQTDYEYDSNHGGLLSATAPVGANGVRPQQRVAYQALQAWYYRSGALMAGPAVAMSVRTGACRTASSCTGGADETVTTVSYGFSGSPNNLLPTSTTTGAGNGSLSATTGIGYDPQGNANAVDGPLPGAADTARTWYDLARRVTNAIGPDPDGGGPLQHRARRLTYAADGGLLEEYDGTAWGYDPNGITLIQNTYMRRDAWGRTVGVEFWSQGGRPWLVERSYDALGRPECVAQRMNRGNYGAWTHACQPGPEGPDGPDRISRTHYNVSGQATGQESAVGTADVGWDWTASYTANGQRDSLTDGENNRSTYEYDGFDRLTTTWFPQPWFGAGYSNGQDYEQLTYDPWGLGQVVQHRQRNGRVIGYGYDQLGNVTSKDLPNAVQHENDISYRYDNMGRLLEARDTGTHFTRLAYDALGRLESEGSNWITRTHGYDAAGRRTRLTFNDGLFITYEHLVTGEVSMVRENGGFQLGGYNYDGLGRRTALVRGNGTRTDYAYDAASNLSRLEHRFAGGVNNQIYGFEHNAAGQITARTASNDAYAWRGQAMGEAVEDVNGLNQVTRSGSANIQHDERGDLLWGGAQGYGHTSEGKLMAAGGNRFAHDPVGRMHWINGHTTLQYDGDALVAELDGDRPYRRRYVHGAGTDEPLIWYEGAGTGDRRWYYADERGSVVALAGGSGAAFNVNSYDEYGMPASGNTGRFGYTGQTWLAEAGAWHYKARTYAPGLGRFMQPDPIGYADGMNPYGYVAGDPVNFADPSGLARVCTTTTGSRIRSCVYVDGDGDGNARERDMSPALVNSLSSSFHQLIVANDGRDLSGYARQVVGNATMADKRRVYAIAQFVGASFRGTTYAAAWASITHIDARADQGRMGYIQGSLSSRPGALASMSISPNGPKTSYITITGQRLSFFSGSFYSNSPSDIARGLIHESLHHIYGRRVLPTWEHHQLDRNARAHLLRTGLGGDGCLPVRGFPGC